MTLLNKIRVMKDVMWIVCWNLASDQRCTAGVTGRVTFNHENFAIFLKIRLELKVLRAT